MFYGMISAGAYADSVKSLRGSLKMKCRLRSRLIIAGDVNFKTFPADGR